MTDPENGTGTPGDPESDTGTPGDSDRRTMWMVAGVLLAVVGVIVALVFVTSDGDDAGDTDSPITSGAPTTEITETTTAPTEPTASSEPATTEPATTEPATTEGPSTTVAGDTTQAVWPWASTDTRFTDPVDAASSFAVDFVGFDDPVIGEFQQGDSRSGEVEVRPFDDGPISVVFVRQLTDDNSWWVIGSATESIVVDTPEPLDVIGSPFRLAGSARAFEGTVDVLIRANGEDEPLYEGFVTGSGGEDLGPFDETIEWDAPGEGAGSLVLLSRSSETGAMVLEAGVLPVSFG